MWHLWTAWKQEQPSQLSDSNHHYGDASKASLSFQKLKVETKKHHISALKDGDAFV